MHDDPPVKTNPDAPEGPAGPPRRGRVCVGVRRRVSCLHEGNCQRLQRPADHLRSAPARRHRLLRASDGADAEHRPPGGRGDAVRSGVLPLATVRAVAGGHDDRPGFRALGEQPCLLSNGPQLPKNILAGLAIFVGGRSIVTGIGHIVACSVLAPISLRPANRYTDGRCGMLWPFGGVLSQLTDDLFARFSSVRSIAPNSLALCAWSFSADSRSSVSLR